MFGASYQKIEWLKSLSENEQRKLAKKASIVNIIWAGILLALILMTILEKLI